jgi:AcrR family transcriptional regulator
MQRATTDHAKDQRRNSLLHAALNEFFNKGFSAARMEDIAKHAQVSKGTLYLYFANKQDLFKALIEEVAIPTISRTSQHALATKTGAEALQTLMQNIAGLIRDTPLPKLVKVIIADGKAFPELVKFYREQMLERMFNLLETLITRSVESKEWQCSDIPMTARLIVAPIIFSVVWRMVFEVSEDEKSQLNLDALFKLHTQYLLLVLSTNSETNNDKS